MFSPINSLRMDKRSSGVEAVLLVVGKTNEQMKNIHVLNSYSNLTGFFVVITGCDNDIVF